MTDLEDTPHSGLSRMRGSRLPLAICATASLVLFGLRSSTSTDAICPNCLTYSRVHHWRVLGIPVWRRRRLSQASIGVMAFPAFGACSPPLSPEPYEDIFLAKCDHRFQRCSSGGTATFMLVQTQQGIHFAEWHTQRGRAALVWALYGAYAHLRNRELAVETYEAIDRAFPLNARNLYDREVHDLAVKLASVETEAEWRQELGRLAMARERATEDRKSQPATAHRLGSADAFPGQ